MNRAEAIQQEKKPKPVCPFCQVTAVLSDSAKIYQGRDFGKIWICRKFPECDARVGVHPGTTNPLGTMADGLTRKWRRRAHEAFDLLWKAKIFRELRSGRTMSKGEARGRAYKWLAAGLGIADVAKDCHIALFTHEQCRKVVELCMPHVEKIMRRR